MTLICPKAVHLCWKCSIPVILAGVGYLDNQVKVPRKTQLIYNLSVAEIDIGFEFRPDLAERWHLSLPLTTVG